MARIESEIRRMRADLGRIADAEEVAMRKAINDTVRQAQAAEVATMRAVFAGVTPYTAKAIGAQFVSANPDKRRGQAAASVFVKARQDVGTGRTRPESFLGPQIEGGGRTQKRFERALQAKGLLPAGWVATPGRGADLDPYGNQSAKQIVQIMSFLGLFSGQAGSRRVNSTEESRAKIRRGTKGSKRNPLGKFGREYLVVPVGTKGGLRPGIWLRKRINSAFGVGRGGVEMLVNFEPRVTYRRRFAFEAVARTISERQLIRNLVRRRAEVRL